MRFSKFENYPVPVFAIDKDGFIIFKNYLATLSFPPVHKGAKAKRYTDIDYSKDILGKCSFCGKDYTFFTIPLDEARLLFLSLDTFGEGFLPFDVYEKYKERVSNSGADDNKNAERKYVREVHKNLVRADFFSSFKNIFEAKNKRALKIHSETTDISSVLLAISVASKNYLEGVDISFDIESDSRLSADILEIDFINLILNVLSFSVINAKDEVRVSLNKAENFAEIEFAFASEFDFNLLGDNNLENSRLNSSLSLLIAITLSEIYSIPFRFEKRESLYRLIFNLPVRASRELVFSKRDNLDEKIKRQLQAIFF